MDGCISSVVPLGLSSCDCFRFHRNYFLSFFFVDVSVTGKTPEANVVERLTQYLKESLLSEAGEGERTALEKSLTETSDLEKVDLSLQVGPVATSPRRGLFPVSGRVASLRSVSLKAMRVVPSQQQPIFMTPAGEVSTAMASLKAERAASPLFLRGGPTDVGHHCISANDSFSLDQPLDTSSAHSVGSGSSRSQGSMSDSLSSSPSPRKNPRRAHLAAKFVKPSQ